MFGSYKTIVVAILLGMPSVGMMSAQSNSSGTQMSTSADTKFVKSAAEGGMAEVSLGKLAVEKASSEDVRKFGQRMVDDHSKANDQLKQLAAQKNITLPQALNAKDKATKASLEKLSGKQFDQAYMKDMVKDHKKDIGDFQQESSSGQDPDVKNFATQTLPTLQDHLKEAQSLTPQMSASSSGQ